MDISNLYFAIAIILVLVSICRVIGGMIYADSYLGDKKRGIPNARYKVKKTWADRNIYYELYRTKYTVKEQVYDSSSLRDVLRKMKEFKKLDEEMKKLKKDNQIDVWLSDDELMIEEL
jgi:hypothetical protein